MALQSSGEISLSDVNVELGNSATAEISMNSTAVRDLMGVSSGQIRLAADGYGKSNAYAFTISSNQTNASLYSLAVAAGWDETMAIEATIDSGVTIYSTSTATPALTVSGFPSGVTLINNGTIVGKGGNGGSGGRGWNYQSTAGSDGTAAGTGLSVSSAMSIDNTNGTIAGGSGGGGGGAGRNVVSGDSTNGAAGGGGGGGIANGTGGSGGSGYGNQRSAQAGQAATLTTKGSGGQGGWNINFQGGYHSVTGAGGGSGGTLGATGSAGGGASSSYGGYKAGGAGGSGGNCTSGNSNITWIATGSRYGTLA